jgi:hypothetical protein
MRDRERTKRFVLSDEGSLLVFPLLWSRGFRLRFFFGLCCLCVEYLSFYLLVSLPSDWMKLSGSNQPPSLFMQLQSQLEASMSTSRVRCRNYIRDFAPLWARWMHAWRLTPDMDIIFFITSSKTTTCNGAMYFTPSITNCMPVLHVELTLTPNY